MRIWSMLFVILSIGCSTSKPHPTEARSEAASRAIASDFFVCVTEGMQGYGFSKEVARVRMLDTCKKLNSEQRCLSGMDCFSIARDQSVYACETYRANGYRYYGAGTSDFEARSSALASCNKTNSDTTCQSNMLCDRIRP